MHITNNQKQHSPRNKEQKILRQGNRAKYLREKKEKQTTRENVSLKKFIEFGGIVIHFGTKGFMWRTKLVCCFIFYLFVLHVISFVTFGVSPGLGAFIKCSLPEWNQFRWLRQKKRRWAKVSRKLINEHVRCERDARFIVLGAHEQAFEQMRRQK